jgi:hypothetical protein
MPSTKSQKGAIPSAFEGIAPSTRHYHLPGKIAIMPRSALWLFLLVTVQPLCFSLSVKVSVKMPVQGLESSEK